MSMQEVDDFIKSWGKENKVSNSENLMKYLLVERESEDLEWSTASILVRKLS